MHIDWADQLMMLMMTEEGAKAPSTSLGAWIPVIAYRFENPHVTESIVYYDRSVAVPVNYYDKYVAVSVNYYDKSVTVTVNYYDKSVTVPVNYYDRSVTAPVNY